MEKLDKEKVLKMLNEWGYEGRAKNRAELIIEINLSNIFHPVNSFYGIKI